MNVAQRHEPPSPLVGEGATGPACRIQRLGRRPYDATYAAMREFTLARTPETMDELWFLEHPPVFTQGQAGKPEHVLLPGDIPVVQSDRGGQVTYHGPGQLVVYFLLDLHRLGYGIRSLVTRLEQALIDTLAGYGIAGAARPDAPGVYVAGRKIASLGLRVRKGCTYHGLALNVNMDLEPFTRINPCGYRGLEMTQIAALGGPGDIDTVARDLEPRLAQRLGLATAAATAAAAAG
ncbi:MAG: lipoyl(octanoyl) transferase LipB [Gammaproteobacteria bacterium]|nr:lipoyl(octanoyl) transferase LipB [Gammaproteobacteria bacterium]